MAFTAQKGSDGAVVSGCGQVLKSTDRFAVAVRSRELAECLSRW